MTTNILSPSWRGLRAEPIDPAAIRFTATAGPVYADCEGCIFISQSSAVCGRAAEISGSNCDYPMHDGRSMIFVLDRSDPRQIQMDLEIEQQSEATLAATDIASITTKP